MHYVDNIELKEITGNIRKINDAKKHNSDDNSHSIIDTNKSAAFDVNQTE